MRLSETLIVISLVSVLTITAVGGALVVGKVVFGTLGVQDPRTVDKRQPIKRGDETRDGLGRAWTADGVTGGDSNPMYYGYPYGR